MKNRCSNPKERCYKWYGGRGIKVCERWLNFQHFVDDVYPSYVEGLTLDRVNTNGNYEPTNFRWATYSQQAYNRRPRVKTQTLASPQTLLPIASLSLGGTTSDSTLALMDGQ